MFKEIKRRFKSKRSTGGVVKPEVNLLAQFQVKEKRGLLFVIDMSNNCEYCRVSPGNWYLTISLGNPTSESFVVDQTTAKFLDEIAQDAGF